MLKLLESYPAMAENFGWLTAGLFILICLLIFILYRLIAYIVGNITNNMKEMSKSVQECATAVALIQKDVQHNHEGIKANKKDIDTIFGRLANKGTS